MKYINVVVENKTNKLDSYYTYKTDDDSVAVGEKVVIPFGMGNKEKDGFVFDIIDEPSYDVSKIKRVLEHRKAESLTEEMADTVKWMKQRYSVRLYDSIRCFVQQGKPPREGKAKEPYKDFAEIYERPESLTEEQTEAVKAISEALEGSKQENFLLYGVTASGKTEVYLEALTHCLKEGKTAIVLVPEISLTKQTIERFAGRFGKEKVAVLHSKLTQRERYDEWQRIRHGDAQIVVGARMAVFAPLENIGLIIMDEEHEATYKSDQTPKYDTVEVAIKRLQWYKGVLVLGSATPSVVSFERCREGIYRLLQLKERYNKTPLPDVELVDMKAELRSGNTSMFSDRLISAMREKLEAGKQVILFQNRRGFSNYVSCRECGEVVKCEDCNLSMVYHKSTNALECHYCGRKLPAPKTCPQCGSTFIKYEGVGTEKVEEEIQELFPNHSVDRLDLDAVKRRSELDKILGKFAKGKTDILVGTQLIAKGLDFCNVGLVGVINADVSLNIPDYRSCERTFQLITQVAGRAGRGTERGLVIVQTYEPENYVYAFAAKHDYNGFFCEEIQQRSFMRYPPFYDIIMVNFTSESEKECMHWADGCKAYVEKYAAAALKAKILAPKLSSSFKGKDSFRHYIIIRAERGRRRAILNCVEAYAAYMGDKEANCSLNVDINPYSFF